MWSRGVQLPLLLLGRELRHGQQGRLIRRAPLLSRRCSCCPRHAQAASATMKGEGQVQRGPAAAAATAAARFAPLYQFALGLSCDALRQVAAAGADGQALLPHEEPQRIRPNRSSTGSWRASRRHPGWVCSGGSRRGGRLADGPRGGGGGAAGRGRR